VAASVEASGAVFILVLVPRFNHWNTEECKACWTKLFFSLDAPFQFEFFNFFEQQKDIHFPVFNLLPDFQATEEYPLVFRTDPHWNAKGHAFVAEKTVDYLNSSKFIEVLGGP
jgi:hypothetical protein